MIQCPVCRISYVNNTLFCNECGLYLLERDDIGTDPFETSKADWLGDLKSGRHRKSDVPDSGPLTIILHIDPPGRNFPDPDPPPTLIPAGSHQRRGKETEAGRRGVGAARNGQPRHKSPAGEIEVPLTRPIRLGRMDPNQDVYPEVDLTDYLALEYGVSREHACISRRGNVIEVEDLSSTNGTLLNGERLAPYLPVPLFDGDQLQLGKLLIQVGLRGSASRGEGRYEPSSPVDKVAFQPSAA
jgi:hypothetical protein